MVTDIFITTGQRPNNDVVDMAESLAKEWKIPFVRREKESIEQMFLKAPAILVCTKEGPVLHTPAGAHSFHLNLAYLRIKNLKKGNHDHMITAMNLRSGLRLLDCTLGLATDAIVASFALGAVGQVVGLESEKALAAVTTYGLKHFTADEQDVTQALRQITVQAASYETFLKSQPDNSFDVVYFDPMFRHPVTKSSQFKPLRTLANPSPLSIEALAEAKRVAKERVVLKETRGSREFSRLGFTDFVGGRYSRIQYGLWQKAVT
ncbi:MAG: class I SAM-dependent methyltransferase [Sporomusaceae bacterium]|nr:class I SAM-dependent methyltransferase [Sporomusaceae bacterium]